MARPKEVGSDISTDPLLQLPAESLIAPVVKNPFSNPAPWTTYDIVKSVLTGILLPPRLLALLACCGLATVTCQLALLGTEEIREQEQCFSHRAPFAVWRRWLLWPLMPLNRIALACLGYWPGCISVNDKRAGRKKTTPLLVVSPHMTFLDTWLLAWAFPPIPRGVGMSDAMNIPVMRHLGLAAQSVFVDRTRAGSRHSCKEEIRARSRSDSEWVADGTGPPMFIFPEGVLTNGCALVRFRKGAFVAGQPVTPVCVQHRWSNYNPAGVGKNFSMGKALLRTMLQFRNVCQIDILDVYEPSEEEVVDPAAFADNVRKTMADHMQVPTTDQSYDDGQIAYTSCAHLGLDFVVKEVTALYGFGMGELTALLKAFEEYNVSRSGTIDLGEFSAALQSACARPRATTSTIRLFAMFDQDQSGAVCLRQFVQAAAALEGRCSAAARAQVLFLALDADGAGVVTAAVLQDMGAASAKTALSFAEFVELTDTHAEVLEASLQFARKLFRIPCLDAFSKKDD